MRSVIQLACCASCFLCALLNAENIYPAEWIRKDLNLAEFFIYFSEHHERIRTLKEILAKGCATGNLKYIHWVVDKQRQTGLILPITDIIECIEQLVYAGFDEMLSCISLVWNFSSLPQAVKNRLIEIAIEVGYPNTVVTLEKIGCRLSEDQRERYTQLKKILVEEPLAAVPVPVNPIHHEAHGGDDNQQTYHHEYRIAVSYVLYHMNNPHCDFLKLIENLGHRRQRMAAMGKLSGIEYYGAPTDQQMITYFSPSYDAYGEKIHQKYSLFPFSVTTLLNGRKIYLTQINEDSWLHPDGEHRAEILQEINALCQKVHAAHYPPGKSPAFLYELGKIIWWMSHAPPFLRGTPTILFILLDALCIYHNHTPLAKIPDLNCEALTYDSMESFATYMSNQ